MIKLREEGSTLVARSPLIDVMRLGGVADAGRRWAVTTTMEGWELWDEVHDRAIEVPLWPGDNLCNRMTVEERGVSVKITFHKSGKRMAAVGWWHDIRRYQRLTMTIG